MWVGALAPTRTERDSFAEAAKYNAVCYERSRRMLIDGLIDMKPRGAYVLYLKLSGPLRLAVGSLGMVFFPAGFYAYVGSARKGPAARVARHKRLAVRKSGNPHWHVDFLLVHPQASWAGETILEEGVECEVSKQIASQQGVRAPVPGFGSSDCRMGCRAHLYLLPKNHALNKGGIFSR